MAVRAPGLSGTLLPAVRDQASLREALDMGYQQVLIERGSLLAMVGALAAAARRGIAIFVNLDGVEGLAPDSAALAFVATDLGLSGVISVKPHVLKEASRFRLRTVQRIHALDSTGLDTGLRTLAVPAPQAVAIAPALALPHIVASVRAVTAAPLWGTGYVTTSAQARQVLAAGADVVSSARREVWQDFQS